MTCECDIPGGGWCERHRCQKSAQMVVWCRQGGKWWEAWESGKGPGQPSAAGGRERPVKLSGGPGTELHRILGWFGLHDQKCCPCLDRAARMDRMGPDGCEREIKTVLRWLQQEAKRRSLPWNAWLAERVVRLAIRRARRASQNDTRETIPQVTG